jgi:hypothetical protein
MKIVKPLPPQELRIVIPAETLAALKLYQHYQKEAENTKWDLKDMAAAMLSVFLAEGDSEFLAWRKRQAHAAVTSSSPPAEPNGATDA